MTLSVTTELIECSYWRLVWASQYAFTRAEPQQSSLDSNPKHDDDSHPCQHKAAQDLSGWSLTGKERETERDAVISFELLINVSTHTQQMIQQWCFAFIRLTRRPVPRNKNEWKKNDINIIYSSPQERDEPEGGRGA